MQAEQTAKLRRDMMAVAEATPLSQGGGRLEMLHAATPDAPHPGHEGSGSGSGGGPSRPKKAFVLRDVLGSIGFPQGPVGGGERDKEENERIDQLETENRKLRAKLDKEKRDKLLAIPAFPPKPAGKHTGVTGTGREESPERERTPSPPRRQYPDHWRRDRKVTAEMRQADRSMVEPGQGPPARSPEEMDIGGRGHQRSWGGICVGDLVEAPWEGSREIYRARVVGMGSQGVSVIYLEYPTLHPFPSLCT